MSESAVAEYREASPIDEELTAYDSLTGETIQVCAGMRLLAERHDLGRGGIACSVTGVVINFERSVTGSGFRLTLDACIWRDPEGRPSNDVEEITLTTRQQKSWWKLMTVHALGDSREDRGKSSRA